MTKTYKFDVFFSDAKGLDTHIEIAGVETQVDLIAEATALAAALSGLGASTRPSKYGGGSTGAAAPAGAPAAPAAPVKVCQKDASHGPMNFVPAGVSRAGKPYSDFYSCDTCRGR